LSESTNHPPGDTFPIEGTPRGLVGVHVTV